MISAVCILLLFRHAKNFRAGIYVWDHFVAAYFTKSFPFRYLSLAVVIISIPHFKEEQLSFWWDLVVGEPRDHVVLVYVFEFRVVGNFPFSGIWESLRLAVMQPGRGGGYDPIRRGVG